MLAADKNTGEIFLYSPIGPSEIWGMETGMADTKSFQAVLNEFGSDQRILLRINSPGGYVDEAIAIFGLLERHPGGVDVAIDSLAASAASFIAMAGETITIAKSGMVMVHGPQGYAAGSSADVRQYADILDKYGERLVPIYADRTGIDAEKIKEYLSGEFWFTATAAVELGFADKIGNPVGVERKIVPENLFKNTPEQFLKCQQRRPQKSNKLELVKIRNKMLSLS